MLPFPLDHAWFAMLTSSWLILGCGFRQSQLPLLAPVKLSCKLNNEQCLIHPSAHRPYLIRHDNRELVRMEFDGTRFDLSEGDPSDQQIEHDHQHCTMAWRANLLLHVRHCREEGISTVLHLLPSP